MRYLLAFAGSAATLVSAHGILDSIIVDGTTYVRPTSDFPVSSIPNAIAAILPLIPVLT
jgi:hypothetical protein